MKLKSKYLALFSIFTILITFLLFTSLFNDSKHSQNYTLQNTELDGLTPSWQHTLTLKAKSPNLDPAKIKNIKLLFLQPKYNQTLNSIPIPFAKAPTITGNNVTLYLPNLLPGNYKIIVEKSNLLFYIKNEINPSRVVNPTPEKCLKTNKGSVPACLDEYFNPKIHDYASALAAVKELEALSIKYPLIRGLCHNVAHDLGEQTILVTKSDPKFTAGLAFCDSGFYHGLFEGNALYLTTEDLKKSIATLCDKYSFLFTTGGCGHSLGHVAYWRTGSLKEGLALCTIVEKIYLTDVDRKAQDCAGGVVMTYIFDYQAQENYFKSLKLSGDPAKIVIGDPFEMCNDTVDDFIKSGCLSHIWLLYANGKPIGKEIFTKCNNEIFSKLDKEQCWYGFSQGFEAGSDAPIEKEFGNCLLANTAEGEMGCFNGLGQFYMNITLKSNYADLICAQLNSLITTEEKNNFCRLMKENEQLITKNGLTASIKK